MGEITFVLATAPNAMSLAQSVRQALIRVNPLLDPMFITSQPELLRYSAGLYHFTADVVAPTQRVGDSSPSNSQLAAGSPLPPTGITGNQALGYVTPGIIFKAMSKLTLYGSWQLGNQDLSEGNHQSAAGTRLEFQLVRARRQRTLYTSH